ncbi:ferrous iron transport protein B [Planctopirus hydrillae]|uniref:Ferrous iron transport protein B n=1 Tax=Planctopirus hydrillae TaxID=1841610 RepID=A0A1C3E4V2_9PLAN|nr:ferrous iron transport protein B [Planctopirus hydrillae]ODA28285.1 ferrous iron transport protein B [Planctopirus hydrillae]
MSLAVDRVPHLAVVGNPNTGKSTLFSALTGIFTRTGNFPGVTVEMKLGRLKTSTQEAVLVDLPGTYSLAARSADERVTVDVLLGLRPEIGSLAGALCIVDGTNLERNLYLFSQVRDLGLPVLLIVNMIDRAEKAGISITAPELSQRLGVPVVFCNAHDQSSVALVQKSIFEFIAQNPPAAQGTDLAAQQASNSDFPPPFETAVNELQGLLSTHGRKMPRPLVSRLLMDIDGQIEQTEVQRWPELSPHLQRLREQVSAAGYRISGIEPRVRYASIRKAIAGLEIRPVRQAGQFSEKLDGWLTHSVFGLLVFIFMMFVVFQLLYRGAEPVMELMETAFGSLQDLVGAMMPRGPLRSLVTQGVIAGVGGVLVFLPQIVLLFLFLAILEDCGYMARAAFLMDRLMTKVGLSGKSFVPLMSSFACAIPGVMATRVIENRKDRMVTILVAPLMSCSARLPVYSLLIGAFIPGVSFFSGWVDLRSLVLLAFLSLGAIVAIPVAWILKKTIFPGETPPFVMELPPYKWPSIKTVFQRVYDRAAAFVVRAGTLILLTSIVIWGLGYFPGDHSRENAILAEMEETNRVSDGLIERRDELQQKLKGTNEVQPSSFYARWIRSQPVVKRKEAGEIPPLTPAEIEKIEKDLIALNQQIKEYSNLMEQLEGELVPTQGQLQENSFLGMAGHWIEPIVRPLGWDWRIGVGVLASFPAREVIIATLGVIYNLGEGMEAESPQLRDALVNSRNPDGSPVFTIPVALSIMVFFALCAQCMATLVVVAQESGSWKWAVFTFVYMTVLAYVGALITFQVASLWW